jgi:hypothetical protein
MNRGQESAHHDVTLHSGFDAIASIFHESPAKNENPMIIEREKKRFGCRNEGLRKRTEGSVGFTCGEEWGEKKCHIREE